MPKNVYSDDDVVLDQAPKVYSDDDVVIGDSTPSMEDQVRGLARNAGVPEQLNRPLTAADMAQMGSTIAGMPGVGGALTKAGRIAQAGLGGFATGAAMHNPELHVPGVEDIKYGTIPGLLGLGIGYGAEKIGSRFMKKAGIETPADQARYGQNAQELENYGKLPAEEREEGLNFLIKGAKDSIWNKGAPVRQGIDDIVNDTYVQIPRDTVKGSNIESDVEGMVAGAYPREKIVKVPTETLPEKGDFGVPTTQGYVKAPEPMTKAKAEFTAAQEQFDRPYNRGGDEYPHNSPVFDKELFNERVHQLTHPEERAIQTYSPSPTHQSINEVKVPLGEVSEINVPGKDALAWKRKAAADTFTGNPDMPPEVRRGRESNARVAADLDERLMQATRGKELNIEGQPHTWNTLNEEASRAANTSDQLAEYLGKNPETLFTEPNNEALLRRAGQHGRVDMADAAKDVRLGEALSKFRGTRTPLLNSINEAGRGTKLGTQSLSAIMDALLGAAKR